MSKVVCLIPARSGSQGIKNKNIKKFNNKPLIYYSINFAKSLEFVDKIIFSTDSRRYLSIAKKYYNFPDKLRPKKFAKKDTRAIDYVKNELANLKDLYKYKFLLLLQPTSPFRNKKDFKKAFLMLKNNHCDSVISSKLVKEHPLLMHKYKDKVNYISKNHRLAFRGRQNYPEIYLRQGSIYFTKIKTLFNTNSLHGGKVKHIVVKGKNAIDLDDYEDLVLMKHYFKKR